MTQIVGEVRTHTLGLEVPRVILLRHDDKKAKVKALEIGILAPIQSISNQSIFNLILWEMGVGVVERRGVERADTHTHTRTQTQTGQNYNYEMGANMT